MSIARCLLPVVERRSAVRVIFWYFALSAPLHLWLMYVFGLLVYNK